MLEYFFGLTGKYMSENISESFIEYFLSEVGL